MVTIWPRMPLYAAGFCKPLGLNFKIVPTGWDLAIAYCSINGEVLKFRGVVLTHCNINPIHSGELGDLAPIESIKTRRAKVIRPIHEASSRLIEVPLPEISSDVNVHRHGECGATPFLL